MSTNMFIFHFNVYLFYSKTINQLFYGYLSTAPEFTNAVVGLFCVCYHSIHLEIPYFNKLFIITYNDKPAGEGSFYIKDRNLRFRGILWLRQEDLFDQRIAAVCHVSSPFWSSTNMTWWMMEEPGEWNPFCDISNLIREIVENKKRNGMKLVQ